MQRVFRRTRPILPMEEDSYLRCFAAACGLQAVWSMDNDHGWVWQVFDYGWNPAGK
jgi:hypothetical protein